MLRALGLCVILSACATRGGASELLGQTMDFTAPRLGGAVGSSLAGGTVTLASLRGMVVLVDVWASWCVPCQESFPFLETLKKRFVDRGFEVVALSVDEDRAVAEAFLAQRRVTFPVVWDDAQRVVQRYPVRAMPTSLVLDRDGVVRYVHDGFDPGAEAAIEGAVEAALSGGAR